MPLKTLFDPKRPFYRLRIIALAEGLSFLILLGIAMPLKYMAGYPIAVSIVGALHGFLFVVLGGFTADAILSHGKTWAWGFRMFLASIVPLAPSSWTRA